MSQDDQLYSFLLAVYKQITPERVYSWIKADSEGRGILRRTDYAFGFKSEEYPQYHMNPDDDNEEGLLRILTHIKDSKTKQNYCELECRSINRIIERVTKRCTAIKEMLGYSLTADYERLDGYKKHVLAEWLKDISHDVSCWEVSSIPQDTLLYRLREISSKENAQILDFYHIPFTQRYLMRTFRYSIPGYPSLYVASSVYGAWEEMGREKINKYGYIAFKAKQDLKLLDLRWRFDEEFSKDKEQLMLYILKLPIIIACSMQLRNSSERYVPEYIFPQQIFMLLMEVLQKNDRDYIWRRKKSIKTPTIGVMYTSCKKAVWEELCASDKLINTFCKKGSIEEITNYALLTYFPMKGAFYKYSYSLGENLYASNPYWIEKEPSVNECAHDTLYSIQRHFENERLVWQDLGDEIKKAEKIKY